MNHTSLWDINLASRYSTTGFAFGLLTISVRYYVHLVENRCQATDRCLLYAKPRGATVTMVRRPNQDWPDGGPRQYTRYHELYLADYFTEFSTFHTDFLAQFLLWIAATLRCSQVHWYLHTSCMITLGSCLPLDIPLCIQFEELINLNPTYFTAKSLIITSFRRVQIRRLREYRMPLIGKHRHPQTAMAETHMNGGVNMRPISKFCSIM